ncbi:PTS sugar transporter subunit IIC [Irregularibacter muris]|uniref:PTS sugar transporter subunit IIC n=1 Tax=Irregularibacter muris TaxID=1796619 RepID=A0AAE3HFM1_9FIRM|nr:PTS sugar transporter subunit IIC [Irregularibacter muris]MCR1898243.1 PTS sugar transporter subunit IIC [Irregularibacter muris]
MLTQALLVALILGLFKMEFMLGYIQICRPIVISTAVGWALGDASQGVIIGSVLELMFIGSFPIGAAVSPDYGSAGAICTAFAILTEGGTAIATALAVPVALLGGFIFIGCKLMASFFSRLMSNQIEKGNMKAVSRTYLFGGWFVSFVPYFIYGFVSLSIGYTAVNAIVDKLPVVVINGLATAANLLPAIGFALLLQMIINKKVAPFFFLGFMLAAYLGMSTLAITFLGVIVVLILSSIKEDNAVLVNSFGGDDNEF